MFSFLGVWHFFKIGLEKIWSEHFGSYWYLFCNYLFENQTQIRKPKLSFLMNFLFTLSCEFENVRDEYGEYLKNDEEEHFSTVANFYHILTKTIPKFKNFGLSLKLNNFDLFLHCFKGNFYLKKIYQKYLLNFFQLIVQIIIKEFYYKLFYFNF